MRIYQVFAILWVISICISIWGRLRSHHDCGAAPTAPGIAAVFKDGTATMVVADYVAITTYENATSAWQSCMEAR